MNKIKLTLAGILISVATVIISLATGLTGSNLGNVNSGLSVISFQDSASATSSVSYLSPSTATSSIIVNLQRVDAVDFNIAATASTSAGILVYNYDCSQDGITFFQPASNASSVSLATSTNLVASNVAYKNISIPTCVAKYLRINYSASVASTSLWTEVAIRNPLKP